MSTSSAENQFGAVRSLSVAVTSHALNAPNNTWPFVSLPNFEARAKELLELSRADTIIFAPIVPRKNKGAWESYSVVNQGWIVEGLEFQGLEDVDPGSIPDSIYPFENADSMSNNIDFYVPLWQVGRAPTNSSVVNVDLLSHSAFRQSILDILEVKQGLLSEVVNVDFLLESTTGGKLDDQPRSLIFEPVLRDFEEDSDVVGFVIAVVPWQSYFVELLPAKTDGFLVEVQDMCGAEFTYVINGPKAIYFGEGGLHKAKYESMRKTAQFAEFASFDGETAENRTVCKYELRVYPTEAIENQFITNQPAIFTSVIVLVFFFTIGFFIVYDYTVQRRQNILLSAAQRTTAIVSSLFPKSIQQRIMQEAEDQAAQDNQGKKRFGLTPGVSQLKEFLTDGSQMESGPNNLNSKPIADLFPDVTIMFADIVGFTAWSSMREPSQVFTLLETIYHEFDEIAKRRRVFKVETVGDCYVAVAGLPEPRKDHHTVMARFARDCLHKFSYLVKKLEVKLGPDTGDLGLRTGLHSGQVTAGVLRGERARFQLFGDAVNTTARMESNGQRDKIHISQETADLLVGNGKGHWITPRAEKIHAKGKGELQTYWLDLKGDASKSRLYGGSSHSGDDSQDADTLIDATIGAESTTVRAPGAKSSAGKHQRLVDWNTDILMRILREITARRGASGEQQRESAANITRLRGLEQGDMHKRDTVLDEVEEIVNLPKFNVNALKVQQDPDTIDLGENIFNQLRDYVATIAAMYRDNPFHNFEHASHVTMSTVKLLSRIVAPDLKSADDNDEEQKLHDLHDHTYGITSDPLTQFACIFAALIHDVDHVGVPNSQLVKEKAHVATVYRNKSVAEQNSVDLAWDLLMDHNYEELRRCIYSNENEFKRFRQLVVNAVMATDIMDTDLKNLRNIRWEKAFSETSQKLDVYFEDTINRKATIVIEHLIQASDVSHTMQHWHIYRKWNERLFHELYRAWVQGRSDTDPSINWYKGEMGFFDFYIIPLAKKLKECGVFGVSSDEYLNYAMKNRKEWELRGQEVVESMVEDVKEAYADSPHIERLAEDPIELTPELMEQAKLEPKADPEVTPVPVVVPIVLPRAAPKESLPKAAEQIVPEKKSPVSKSSRTPHPEHAPRPSPAHKAGHKFQNKNILSKSTKTTPVSESDSGSSRRSQSAADFMFM